jgi:predicted NAD/FAD-binding protein
MNRKNFLRLVGVLGAGAILTPAVLLSTDKKFSYPLRSLAPLHIRGHRLRKAFNPKDYNSVEIIEKEFVIVGGGVSGLSSAYFLEKQNVKDYVLLEMNEHLGGNAAASQTKGNKFPLGAHYLSLPNPTNVHLIDFLKELNLITEETEKGLVYSEEHLVHAPDERLLYRGNFQEGLVPEYGITTDVKAEIEHFLETMKEWKYKKSVLGKDIFSIPLSTSEHSEELLELDQITFDKWLDEHNFKSKELRWFLDYCCRDDYGAGSSIVSAWAGIHYFAGRKAKPAISDPTSVMTWPEGNNFLVKKLAHYSVNNTQTDQLVHQIIENQDEVLIYTMNCNTEKKTVFKAKKCI